MATTVVGNRPPRSKAGVRLVSKRELVRSRLQFVVIGAFLAAHVPLAIVLRTSPAIATAHALVCLAVGLSYALTTRHIRNVAVVGAYMVGCEVLWRMTKVTMVGEFGKYSLIVILLVALTRISGRKNLRLALMYFGFLVPSIALAFNRLDLDLARQEVSFYLSGPLALAIAVIFFSNISLTRNQLFATFIAVIGPVVGIATLSFLSTVSHDDIEFFNGANIVTSGGFGPNQVSAMLGLGAMLALLIVLESRNTWVIRLLLIGLATVLAAQSALTFSRGGIVLAFAGLSGAAFVLLRGSWRGRVIVLVVAALGFGIGNYVVEPRLEAITNGKLGTRYATTKSSGRQLFVASELELFSENPILGVGPGVGRWERAERGELGGASHTEYSRVLGEHGLFGLFAMCCLIALAVRAVKHAQPSALPVVVALIVWVAVFVALNSTRIAAPSLIFGLAFARRPAPTAKLSPLSA